MPRIIVAEDDEIVAEIVRDTLIQAGHAVGVVQDGAAALDVIRAKRPDMVILDCSLPSMTGVQIVRQMRIDYDLWEIPALMLTARVSASDEDLAMYAGADEYMRKPSDPIIRHSGQGGPAPVPSGRFVQNRQAARDEHQAAFRFAGLAQLMLDLRRQ